MPYSRFVPRKVFIDRECRGMPLTKRILKNVGRVPTELVSDSQEFLEERRVSRDVVKQGKKDLFIASQKGEFIKPCPCTPRYIGCNYFIINLDLNCPLDCTYCILQHYLCDPILIVHANREDLWKQLDAFLDKNKGRALRIGTGELGDSLVLDHITENSKDLISYFRGKNPVLFELKTKTVNIENILETEPASNIVISWSLNSPRIARSEEANAPAVEERIEAARRVADKGFFVGFHFDPLIRYPGCGQEYESLITRLFKGINPGNIAWVSLGSLRFPPSLKPVIQERFPLTRIIYEEMVKGLDGKLRYFRPSRLDLYKRIIRSIKENGGEKVPLYLCMESNAIWREALGWVPKGEESLESYLSSPLGNSKE